MEQLKKETRQRNNIKNANMGPANMTAALNKDKKPPQEVQVPLTPEEEREKKKIDFKMKSVKANENSVKKTIAKG